MGVESFVSQVAGSTPFDDENVEFVAGEVQTALEQLDKKSIPPGFTWGRSGQVPKNTWLLNDTVPSNKTGRRIFLFNAKIQKVFVSNENIGTFTIGIFEHSGLGTEILLGSVTVTSKRSDDFDVNFSATKGKELAARITNGSTKNPQVGIIIAGNLKV